MVTENPQSKNNSLQSKEIKTAQARVGADHDLKTVVDLSKLQTTIHPGWFAVIHPGWAKIPPGEKNPRVELPATEKKAKKKTKRNAHTEEANKKIQHAGIGRTQSPEARKKISEYKKNWWKKWREEREPTQINDL